MKLLYVSSVLIKTQQTDIIEVLFLHFPSEQPCTSERCYPVTLYFSKKTVYKVRQTKVPCIIFSINNVSQRRQKLFCIFILFLFYSIIQQPIFQKTIGMDLHSDVSTDGQAVNETSCVLVTWFRLLVLVISSRKYANKNVNPG